MADTHAYATRIDATNFALANDDGSVVRDYERADVMPTMRLWLGEALPADEHDDKLAKWLSEDLATALGTRTTPHGFHADEKSSSYCFGVAK